MTSILSNLINEDNMATESTQEHENINALPVMFSCSSVDSIAIN